MDGLISKKINITDIPETSKGKIQKVLDIALFGNCMKHVFLAVLRENNFDLLLKALKMDAEFQLLDHIRKEEEDKRKKIKVPSKRKTYLKVHALQSLSGLDDDMIEKLLTKLTSKAIYAADLAKRVALSKLEVAVAEEAIRV